MPSDSSPSSTAAMPQRPRARTPTRSTRAAALEPPAAQAARGWAEWIREHAECTDPLNRPLRLQEVTSCSHEALQPHMRGWSTHGPYRH
jgi:hypothetical protein